MRTPKPVSGSVKKTSMSAFLEDPDSEPLPLVADSLPVRLMRAREAVMTRVRPVLRTHGVTEQQWRVLCTVRDLRETEITALADRVFLLAPSLSRILRDLEARGLIRRRPSAHDHRRVLVSATPEGEALVHRVEPSCSRCGCRCDGYADRIASGRWPRCSTPLEAALGPGAPAGMDD